MAIRNCENPAKLDYYEDEEEAREGIEIWHSHQKQALDSSEDEFERVSVLGRSKKGCSDGANILA